MKIVRSLFLGSAAGLIAICGAQAADLPVKAKAVEYVKICSLYGAGFFYIPGTDTCIKIGGYLRVDVTFNGGPHGAPAWNGDLGQQDRYRDYYAARSRRASRLIPAPPLNTALSAPSGWPTSSLRRTAEAHSTRTLSTPTLVTIRTCLTPPAAAFEQLFLQFAGFTFGKPASAYATPWHGFPGNTTSCLLGGHDTVTGTNNIQYTAQFGNGVSGTVGLDDPTVYNRTAVYNLSTGIGATGLGANAYAGMHAADVVGNIRVDQAWGLFQVSAGAHEVSGSYNLLTAGAEQPTALSEISGHPDTKWGGSAMAALQIKNIPTGPGDDIKLDASYAVGDTKNVISAAAPSPSFAMFSGTSVAGAYQSIGLGATSDAVYLPTPFGGTGDLKLTKAWGVRGAFNHNWDPYWSSALFGAYSSVRYDGAAGDLSTAKGSTAWPLRRAIPARGVKPAIRISTSRSSAWSPAGRRSRT
jgi:hypothetical protein